MTIPKPLQKFNFIGSLLISLIFFFSCQEFNKEDWVRDHAPNEEPEVLDQSDIDHLEKKFSSNEAKIRLFDSACAMFYDTASFETIEEDDLSEPEKVKLLINYLSIIEDQKKNPKQDSFKPDELFILKVYKGQTKTLSPLNRMEPLDLIPYYNFIGYIKAKACLSKRIRKGNWNNIKNDNFGGINIYLDRICNYKYIAFAYNTYLELPSLDREEKTFEAGAMVTKIKIFDLSTSSFISERVILSQIEEDKLEVSFNSLNILDLEDLLYKAEKVNIYKEIFD